MFIKSRTELSGKVAIIEMRGAFSGNEETDGFRAAVADFIEQGNRLLVVNMQKVNYINSSGIGALLVAQSSYRRIGGDVKLVGLSSNVLTLLAVTRLLDTFDICASVDDAIDNFVKMKS